jgi:hypothetical protein
MKGKKVKLSLYLTKREPIKMHDKAEEYLHRYLTPSLRESEWSSFMHRGNRQWYRLNSRLDGLQSLLGNCGEANNLWKSSVFWNITPCRPLKVNVSFRGTCRLHIQGWGESKARNQYQAGSKFYQTTPRNISEASILQWEIKLHFKNEFWLYVALLNESYLGDQIKMMRWVACDTHEMRNSYRIWAGKPEGKRPLGRPRRR